ncbi:MAG: glycosyltransferase [Acidimicrobiales bacterium]|nr:glycosyltransferase [Acidimicrobiales bacterium]
MYHSAVVSDWRERDRELRRHGCDVRLLGPRSWNEGGRSVEFERDGDDFVEAAKTWGRHPFLFVYSPLPLIRELRRRRLDILDVHEEPASLAAFEFRVLAWLFQRHVPIVFYGAQNIAKRYPLPFRWIERGSLERASGAHCCNADAGRIFRDKGFRGAMRVIGLGIDVAQFAPSAPPRISDQFHLGYVGRLERHKGVAVLIEAIAPVEGTYLEIYGDGPARDELESLVQRKGLAHRVTFHGFRSHGELPGVYQSLDALALPSLRTRTWMEQFGRVAVEAMASGLPVLVSDVGALPEVVGDAGVSVPAGDIAAWRQAIASIIADPCARSELGKMGIAQAQTYSWHCIAAAHLSLYREVVA